MTSIYLGNQAVYDPLVLPNNSRINGVEHFYQSTKPTTRGDGSALGIGDRWWKIDEGTEWFWNGTYWLSKPFTIGDVIGVRDMRWTIGEDMRGIFLHSIVAKGRTATDPPNWDANNYWKCNLIFASTGFSDLAILDSIEGYVGGADWHYYKFFNLQYASLTRYPSVAGSNAFFSQIRAVGNPVGGAGGFAQQLSYFFKLSYIFL